MKLPATRQLILEQAGYLVSSAFDFAEALEICKTRHDFDLILMGHSMPQKDKMALFIRTIGIARARLKIGMANLVYNFRRLVYLDRLAAP